MSEDELKEMMYEANKIDRDGIVSRDDFMNILTNQDNWFKLIFKILWNCLF